MGGGTLGVAATVLGAGQSVFYNADVVFPTASVIKIAIVAELLSQAAEGRVSLDRTIVVTSDAVVAGSGILAHLTPGLSLPLSDLAMLTISVSDNTASNLCLAAVGGPAVVNASMRAWGMTETAIHRPIKFSLGQGDPPHTATGTPRDMHHLVKGLAANAIHSSAVSREVLRLMGLVRDGELLVRYLEVNPYAETLRTVRSPFDARRKTGQVTGVRNDAGLISRGAESLAVCVYTKDVPDTRWTAANAGSEAVARVGKLLCDTFFA
jgi:beta-lactamase class A